MTSQVVKQRRCYGCGLEIRKTLAYNLGSLLAVDGIYLHLSNGRCSSYTGWMELQDSVKFGP